ncbi:MAG: dTDP-4-amino-4,6-dideoxygalactose transaminase [Deltaproteobacteria bacterium]|nr:dTDP-4-amino-4,6-dideoxygalactose transaminase [Deltaproteobacteria bacterium]
MDKKCDQCTIPFNRPFIIGKELINIQEAVNRRHLAGDGYFTERCHRWLEDKLGCKRALLTHSCTGALEISALLANIQEGDEIIMPSFTFVSTANAFVLRGGVPVFIDIREDTLNIDEEKIEAAISPRTKMIVPVHYAGVPCEMGTIMKIAESNKLLVAEDAAHSMLSKYQGRYVGTIGDIGCLSFHETKNIISGEGGALLINREDFIERAEIIREKGTDRQKFSRGEVDKYSWLDIGSSYLPSELVGAFLCAQLEEAENIIRNRIQTCHLYTRLLKPLENEKMLLLPVVKENQSQNGHMFYVMTRSFDERRGLIEHLMHQGIKAIFHYIPLHSSPAGRKYGKMSGNMKVTDRMSDRILRLPLYYGITEKEVATVARDIYSFYGRCIADYFNELPFGA